MPNPRKASIRTVMVLAVGLTGVGWVRRAEPQAPPVARETVRISDPLPPLADPDRLGAIWFRQGEFIRALAFSPDGKTLATAGSPSVVAGNGPVVHLWDVASGKEFSQLESPDAEDLALSFSPDGKRLAVAGGGIRVHDLTAGKLLWSHELGRNTDAHALAFSPDGRWIAAPGAGGKDGDAAVQVKIWDAATGEEKQACAYPARVGGWGVTALAFSPDSHWLAAGGNHAGVRMWNVANGEQVRSFSEAVELVYTVAFSPNGALLAAGDSDGDISLWETATGKLVNRLRAPADDLLPNIGRRPGADFGPGFGGGRRFRPPNALEVRWIAFTSSGTTLVAAGYDWRVQLWNVSSGQVMGAFPLRGRYWDQSLAIALSPDGWIAESSSRFGIVRVYDLVDAAPPLAQIPVETLWNNLTASDAFILRRTMRELVDRPEISVRFLAKHLAPATPTDTRQYDPLLARLDSDRYETRERAEAELRTIGPPAEPALRKLLSGPFSAEARARAERLLETINPHGILALEDHERQSVQAVRVLARINTPDARALLERLATGAPEAPQTTEARSLIRRIAPPEEGQSAPPM